MKKRCLTCCIIILILVLLLGGVGAFAVLYMPKPATIIDKFTSEGLTAVYAEASEDGKILGDEDLALGALFTLAGYQAMYEDVTFEGIMIFYSETEEEETPETRGILLFTDSIKSAANVFVDFYSNKDTEELRKELHASLRGKVVFLGNTNAELAFRKIIF